MGGVIYIRLKKHITVNEQETIRLQDVAYITGKNDVIVDLQKAKVYTVDGNNHSFIVIDVFQIIKQLLQHFPELEFQVLGPEQTILKIKRNRKATSLFFVPVIWILLFIGTAMAIMNFHYDVSMQEVQQKLHYLLTGENIKYPLWMQIPYSIGLGVGMTLFFNHLFKKRFNEEPSPLEIEMFNYQQDLDQYISFHDNDLNKKNYDSSD